MIKAFDKLDNSKKIPIVIGVAIVLIVFVTLVYYFKNKNVGYSDLKEDSTKAFVYTINSEKNDTYFMNVPYVNIQGAVAKEVNEDVDSFAAEFSNNEKIMLSYEYDINGRILSLLVKCVDYDVKYVPKVYFRTYNIDLENQKLLSDEELLSIYNITTTDVSNFIEKKFTYWYKDVVKQGYVEEKECDYICFLEYREVEDYLDDVVYYVERGNLVAYKPFVFYSIFGEEEYFKEKDFKFEITKEDK